jgi:hypothetical protein
MASMDKLDAPPLRTPVMLDSGENIVDIDRFSNFSFCRIDVFLCLTFQMTELNRKMKGRYHISDSWMVECLSDTGNKVEILNSFLSSIIFFSVDF